MEIARPVLPTPYSLPRWVLGGSENLIVDALLDRKCSWGVASRGDARSVRWAHTRARWQQHSVMNVPAPQIPAYMFNPKRKALVPAQYSSVSVRWEIPQSRAPIIQTEIIMISCVSRARLANTKTRRALLLVVLVRVAARLHRRGARVCRHAPATRASSGRPLAQNAARVRIR